MRLCNRLIFVLLLSIAFLSFPSLARAERMTWMIDGVEREALVFAPANPTGKLPVVFGFHWGGGTMQQDVGSGKQAPSAIAI
jgi:hypothetical protein